MYTFHISSCANFCKTQNQISMKNIFYLNSRLFVTMKISDYSNYWSHQPIFLKQRFYYNIVSLIPKTINCEVYAYKFYHGI